MRDIFEPSISMAPFQAQLDAAVKNYPGVRLRLEWAPRLTECKVIDRSGNTRVYRKYPLLGMETREYHVGNYFRRDGKVIAYERTGQYVPVAHAQGLVVVAPPNVRATDLVVPHLERVNHSVHLFVIEKQLPDDYAREQWAKKRELSRAQLGIDIFGSFPQEGVWTWFDDISEHHSDCCEIAEGIGVRCQGLYREPDARDLENVRAALKEWDDRKSLADNTPLIEQAAKDYAGSQKAWEDNERLNILKEARECSALDKIAHERTRITGGVNPPLHRSAY